MTTNLLYAGLAGAEVTEKIKRAKRVYGHVPDFQALWNIWFPLERRQAQWQAATKALADNPKVGEWASCILSNCRLPAKANHPHAISHSSKDVTVGEIEVCGEEVTQGSPTERLQFWRFVELAERGYTPSDLKHAFDTTKGFVDAIAVAETLGSLEDDPTGEVRRKRNDNRYNEPDHPTYPRHAARVARQYASLYRQAGHQPEEVCRYVRGAADYLTKPHDAATATPGDHSLRYWQLYGIESLEDIESIPPRPQVKVFTPLKVKPMVMAVQEIGTNDARGLLILQAKQFMKKLPRSQCPLAYLAAQRLYVMQMVRGPGRAAVYAQQETRLNETEELFFGNPVTEGTFLARLQFWKLLAQHDHIFKLFNSPSGVILMECAKSMIAEGADPAWYAKPRYEGGRGGLTDPISPDKFSYVEHKFKSEYMPLYQWGAVEEGLGSPSLLQLSSVP